MEYFVKNNSSEKQKFVFDNNPTPQLEIVVNDEEYGELGFLVIDNLEPGICAGGIRLADDVTRREVAQLARAMSLKFAFRNSFRGGAKAGIICAKDVTQNEKTNLLKTFGRYLAPVMKAFYSPGGDIGVGPDELRVVYEGAGLPISNLKGDALAGNFTARGVFVSASTLLQKMKKKMEGASIAIEGYGSVGRPLARFFYESDCKIIALSTICGAVYNPSGLDIDEIERLAETYGDEVVHKIKQGEKISSEDLYLLKTDILIPGARPWVISTENVRDLEAKAIVPAANIPVEPDALSTLQQKNIGYVPDFVSTSGGVMGSHLFSMGFEKKDVMNMITDSFSTKVSALYDSSIHQRKSMQDVAVEIAYQNYVRLKRTHSIKRDQKPSLFKKISEEKNPTALLEKVCFRLFKSMHGQNHSMQKMFKGLAIRSVSRKSLSDIVYYPGYPEFGDKEKN